MSNSFDLSSPQKADVSSNEVKTAARKKRYSQEFKLRLIEEAERCTAPGELAALLRREGIYFSTLSDFRKQKGRGVLDTKSKSTTQRQPAQPHIQKELAASEREVRRLKRELECARALLDLQKKVSEILGLTLLPED